MNPRDFCWWLKGILEGQDYGLTTARAEHIKYKLEHTLALEQGPVEPPPDLGSKKEEDTDVPF